MPARTIGDDYFRYDEARHALIGDHTGETYRLGDHVTVKLVEAAPVAGALRFELYRRRAMTSSPSGQAARPHRQAYRPARPRPQARSKGRQEEEMGMTEETSPKSPPSPRPNATRATRNVKPRDAATLILVDRSGPLRRFCSAGATRD